MNIPLEAAYRWSLGVFPGFSKTIVEVETKDGVIGLGEAPNADSARTIQDAIAPRLLGADPYDLADCERRVVPPLRVLYNTEDWSIPRAYAGVEIALWDVIGKLEGRSIASLLGGRVRTEATFTEYFAYRLRNRGKGGEESPADVAAYCARMVEQHESPYFEGKVGLGNLDTDVRIVKEVRNAIGEERLLRLDANMSWTTLTARGALRQLEPYNVQSIEEPVGSLEEMARLRSHTSIAFSAHEPNLRAAMRLGVPDAFVINLPALGGIRRACAFIAACEQLGVDVWFYSPDTGVANAAYLQISAAFEWIRYPSQTLLRWHVDDVLSTPFVPRAGKISIPDGDGLGVELDRKALGRCHNRFLEEGPYDQYSDPARSGGYLRGDLH